MPSRPMPLFIDARSVGNILEWRPISRGEAIRLQARGLLVVVLSPQTVSASRFDESSPYWHAHGPYDYVSLRYFAYTGSGTASPGAMPGRVSPARKPASPAVEEKEEYAPLEEPGEAPTRAAPEKAQASVLKPKTELRFDLALDPATPGLEDDVFVLSSGDGNYNQVRTVKDDKVPGDKKLTLIFPGVTEGKTYTLSQVHDGEEVVLVPSVTSTSSQPASPSTPGEVIGCKAAFRECRILGEAVDIHQPEEPRYPFELAFAKDKWVYVFGGPPGGAVSLLAEGRGTGDGDFWPVDLKKHGGKNLRPFTSKASAWLTLPLKVNDREWDLFACLSPIQLPWKRVLMLQKNPLPRCYRIGDATGGACWVPGHIGREVPKLSEARDPRIADPGKDIVMIGLVDYMAEAKRRAKVYQRELKPYLENRFDTSIDKGKATPEQLARRRKKHIAGLLKVLLEQHPQKRRLAECLAQEGKQLDQYLRDENERELRLLKRFSAAAKHLVKWMDSPEKSFEESLIDYMADPEIPELWAQVEAEIAFLTAYFEVSSLTRLFGKRMVERKDSWVNQWLLNPERFPGIRKPTQATVEVIGWLSNVIFQLDTMRIERLTTLYGAWFSGTRFREWVYQRQETLEAERKTREWFPSERQAKSSLSRKVRFESLSKPGARVQTKLIQASFRDQSLEKLNLLVDSKIMTAVLAGLELNNFYFAMEEWNRERTGSSRFNLGGAVADSLGLILESAAKAGARIGRGALASWSVVCSFCDFYSALTAAEKAAEEKDYEQIAAQLGIAAGSATMAVGASMVAATVFTSMVAGETLLTAGLGLSMTGAGSAPGAIVFLIGGVIVAASAVAGAILVDDELEMWLTECPFGKFPDWDPGELIAPTQIAILFEMLHPVKVSIKHDYARPPGRYVVTLSGPFNELTEITVLSLELADAQARTTTILRDEILEEKSGHGFEVHSEPGDVATIHLSFSDEMCWRVHKEKHLDFDNRFKYARLNVRIDIYNDKEIWLPSRAVRRPLVLPIG